MAFSFPCTSSTIPYLKPRSDSFLLFKYYFIGSSSRIARQSNLVAVIIKCESSKESRAAAAATEGLSAINSSRALLEIGSPIIVIEAPKMIKTAASVPCLRVNAGLVKPGDVGRIVSRKPKDVWAVRLTIGTYLIDGKYFKPLELDE